MYKTAIENSNVAATNAVGERILSLHSFRFVFAMMIFFHHIEINGVRIFDAGGSCAVTFFMILSGFLLTLGYGEKVLKPQFSFKPYITKRLMHIYPVHLLMLLIFILAFHKYALANIAPLLPNMLLLQSWIPDKIFYFSFNGVSWYLSDTILFYLLFPTIIRCIYSLKRGGALLLFAAIIACYFIAQSFVPDDRVNDFIYISPLFRLVDFIIGVALCLLYKQIRAHYGNQICRMSYFVKSAIECAVIALMTITIIYFNAVEERFATDSYFWLPTLLLILTFALMNRDGGVFTSLLSCKIPIWLGSISLEFYIVHWIALMLVKYLLFRLNIAISPYYSMVLYLGASLILSIVIKRYFNPLIAKISYTRK
jgi:peptidoglycan/LPS O-acetylase OafA/YrhL